MNQHIIYKQQATIQVAKEEQAYAVQNLIADVLKNELPQQLEAMFDELTPDGEIVRIDLLQLDLGTLPMHNIKQSFAEQVIEKIREAIVVKKENAASENGTTIIRKETSLREAFFHFLQHGTKPWFTSEKRMDKWESEMQQSFTHHNWQKITIWLRSNYSRQPIVIERLISQFSDGFLENILAQFTSFTSDEWKKIYNDLVMLFYGLTPRKESETRSEIWLYCVTSFLKEQQPQKALYNVVKEMFGRVGKEENYFIQLQAVITDNRIKTDNIREIAERLTDEMKNGKLVNSNTDNEKDDISHSNRNGDVNNSSSGIDETENKKQRNNKLSDNGISKETEFTNTENTEQKKNKLSVAEISKAPQYVSNSGIVLLHPFLEPYFDEFGLLRERKFTDDAACKRAVLLLHYLAAGETEIAEFDLLLQKILCGLLPEETLPNVLRVTEKETEESEKLLRSVISYWPPLKNTSVEGLRSTFLQREGKLEKKENGWLLTAEQKTVDILLDKLPWGFSTIRLPWMNEMINVDWC